MTNPVNDPSANDPPANDPPANDPPANDPPAPPAPPSQPNNDVLQSTLNTVSDLAKSVADSVAAIPGQVSTAAAEAMKTKSDMGGSDPKPKNDPPAEPKNDPPSNDPKPVKKTHKAPRFQRSFFGE